MLFIGKGGNIKIFYFPLISYYTALDFDAIELKIFLKLSYNRHICVGLQKEFPRPNTDLIFLL